MKKICMKNCKKHARSLIAVPKFSLARITMKTTVIDNEQCRSRFLGPKTSVIIIINNHKKSFYWAQRLVQWCCDSPCACFIFPCLPFMREWEPLFVCLVYAAVRADEEEEEENTKHTLQWKWRAYTQSKT